MKSEAAARRRRQHGSSARGRRRREDFNSGRVDCRPLQHLSTRRTGIIFLLFPFCPEINFQPLLTSVPIVLQVPIKGMEQGESVSLPVFIQDMSPNLLRTTPPGHTGQRQPRPFLSPQSQRLIFRLIELLFEEIPVRCFRQIRRVHIMVCLQSERPFFSSRIQESPDRTRAQMCQNVNSMGLLIRDMIIYQPDQGGRASKPSVLPREVKHLINLMLLPDPIRMKVPIQCHSCLVPIEYRGFLFTIEYQFIMDVLRYADREGFRYVLRGLEPMGDWSVNVRNSNRYLQQFFNKGRYDPYGLRFQSNPILEPLDYNRNVPSHTLEGSVSRRDINGMRFTRATINRACTSSLRWSWPTCWLVCIDLDIFIILVWLFFFHTRCILMDLYIASLKPAWIHVYISSEPCL